MDGGGTLAGDSFSWPPNPSLELHRHPSLYMFLDSLSPRVVLLDHVQVIAIGEQGWRGIYGGHGAGEDERGGHEKRLKLETWVTRISMIDKPEREKNTDKCFEPGTSLYRPPNVITSSKLKKGDRTHPRDGPTTPLEAAFPAQASDDFVPRDPPRSTTKGRAKSRRYKSALELHPKKKNKCTQCQSTEHTAATSSMGQGKKKSTDLVLVVSEQFPPWGGVVRAGDPIICQLLPDVEYFLGFIVVQLATVPLGGVKQCEQPTLIVAVRKKRKFAK
uniref:Uncharacterized protein n=1 Tax=Aegilops tauschii TaxID=37682 RepID=N1QT85_AEGTA